MVPQYNQKWSLIILQYKVSFELLYYIQCFLPYILGTLSRTDVPHGDLYFMLQVQVLTELPSRSTGYPAFVTKLQVASELCMSRVYVLYRAVG